MFEKRGVYKKWITIQKMGDVGKLTVLKCQFGKCGDHVDFNIKSTTR